MALFGFLRRLRERCASFEREAAVLALDKLLEFEAVVPATPDVVCPRASGSGVAETAEGLYGDAVVPCAAHFSVREGLRCEVGGGRVEDKVSGIYEPNGGKSK